MKSYNDEYYILLPENPDYPILEGHDENAKFEIKLAQKLTDTITLFCSNLQGKRNSSQKNRTPDILFGASEEGLIVPQKACDFFLQCNIPHLLIRQVIYIGGDIPMDKSKCCIAFMKTFDCWDRKKSTVDNALPIIHQDVKLHKVLRYSLNDELLDKTPLEERLLFIMGGVLNGSYLVCHESIRDHLRKKKYTGVKFVPIADFEVAHDIYGAERMPKKEHKPPRWVLILPFLVTVFLIPMVIPGIIGLWRCYRKLKEYTTEPVKWLSRMIGIGLAALALMALIVSSLIFLFFYC